jgi:hypothetical protein
VSRGSEVVRAVTRLRPDFVLVDLSFLLDSNILDEIRGTSRGSRVFATTDTIFQQHRLLAERMGLDGLFEKSRLEESISREIGALGGADEGRDE